MNLLFELANRVGLVIMLSFVFSRTKVFKNVFLKKGDFPFNDKIVMALFYGGLGILGTYTGIAFKGAIVNTRVIGVVVGGLIGGPAVGFMAGAVAGIHRYFVDPGGMTSFGCAVSTISEGLLAGYLSKSFSKSENPILHAWITGTVAEIMQMTLIILLVSPYEYAYNLVSIIGLPMIIMNAIGIAVFVAIVENIKNLQDSEAASRAQQILDIADKSIQYFRQGLTTSGSKAVADIIYDKTDFKAVAITDDTSILAHIGVGQDHGHVGTAISTEMTKKVLASGTMVINRNTDGLNAFYVNHNLKCGIIVPLKMKEKTVGTLKLYKDKVNSIKLVDEELAKGLANLFSTQLELSKIAEKEELRSKAELKALQAQINPHFLFNAINTIVSLVRTEPDKARELLIHLGDYFRNNMQINREFIPLSGELKHIEAYIKIEKARFGEKLEIIYELPERLDMEIPPLIIQPIVENAVKHGVFPKIDKGTVSIIIKIERNFLDIRVSDDGVGMEEVVKNDSIGLKNVKKRLENVYGDQYTFEIQSELNLGTSVKMLLPLNHDGKGVQYD